MFGSIFFILFIKASKVTVSFSAIHCSQELCTSRHESVLDINYIKQSKVFLELIEGALIPMSSSDLIFRESMTKKNIPGLSDHVCVLELAA